MMPTFRRLLVSAAGLLLAGSARALPAEDANRPVLVELFTSQGCNSCPPADALLGELAHRPGVIALAFHVDYWNGLGWRDPFSSALATARQHDYARRLGARSVYTPQLVVDGAADTVGSDRVAVDRLIAAARVRAVEGPSIALVTTAGGGRVVRLGSAPPVAATVWLAGYDVSHVTPVGRGENGGRTLTEFQIVRALERLGPWSGERVDYPLVDVAGERRLIIIQPDTQGPILAVRDITG